MRMKKVRYFARYVRQICEGLATTNSSLVVAGARGLVYGTVDVFMNCVDRRPLCYCNICSWEGARFIPNAGSGYFLRHYICPSCGELGRYRMLYALLAPLLSDGVCALEIGPNRAFGQTISQRFPVTYICSDLSDRRASLRSDLTAMPVADSCFDVILCMHVLEHVPDDRAATSELFRTLKAPGTLYVQVPMSGEPNTVEYGFANPQDNEHFRIYGRDIENRLAETGFKTQPIRPYDLFAPAEIERLGLQDERTPIFECTKS